jgi:hypothetical protein
VAPPEGWEGRIFRRPEAGESAPASAGVAAAAGEPAPAGEQTFPIVHVATIALPPDMADYGSDVVRDLGPSDAFIVIKEFDPLEVVQPLFANAGLPRELDPDDFDPATLQRTVDGQAGLQAFFNEAGRAFTLYVVLGSFAQRHEVVPVVNGVLASIRIDPLG